MLPFPRDQQQNNERGDLGYRHREQCAARGKQGIVRETDGEKQPRPRLNELLDDLGKCRGRHNAAPLPVSAENRDERNGQNGRRKSGIAP